MWLYVMLGLASKHFSRRKIKYEKKDEKNELSHTQTYTHEYRERVESTKKQRIQEKCETFSSLRNCSSVMYCSLCCCFCQRHHSYRHYCCWRNERNFTDTGWMEWDIRVRGNSHDDGGGGCEVVAPYDIVCVYLAMTFHRCFLALLSVQSSCHFKELHWELQRRVF